MQMSFHRVAGRAVAAFAVVATLMLIGAAPASADDSQTWLNSVFGSPSSSSASRATTPSRRATRASRTAASEDRPARRTRTRTASRPDSDWRPTRSGGIAWVANSGCLNSTLRGVISDVAARFGSVRVSSTCRSAGHNARIGGAKRSYHLTGDAADFRVSGNVSAVYSFLRSNGSVGGLKHYGGGLFHIDNGPSRPF